MSELRDRELRFYDIPLKHIVERERERDFEKINAIFVVRIYILKDCVRACVQKREREREREKRKNQC